jgi:hypothetical protein
MAEMWFNLILQAMAKDYVWHALAVLGGDYEFTLTRFIPLFFQFYSAKKIEHAAKLAMNAD